MGISRVFHAVEGVVRWIGFDTIAVAVMVVSLLGMLVAVTLYDSGGVHAHPNAR